MRLWDEEKGVGPGEEGGARGYDDALNLWCEFEKVAGLERRGKAGRGVGVGTGGVGEKGASTESGGCMEAQAGGERRGGDEEESEGILSDAGLDEALESVIAQRQREALAWQRYRR